jgi:hypothetical protein
MNSCGQEWEGVEGALSLPQAEGCLHKTWSPRQGGNRGVGEGAEEAWTLR